MSTLERNRVFEQSALEEFEQGADSVLQAAEDISICMASHMGTVVSLCQSVPSEAREPGLSELASQAGQEIAGKDYSTIRERIKKEIETIRDTVYTFDKQAAEAQAEAIQASVRADGMIETLGSLLEAGLLALPYEDFQETLGEFKREVEEAVPDIEEKMKYAEDILGGLQSYAALYSSDPVHLATGNFYYEKEALRVEGDPPLKLSLYYNAISRRKGTLLRNWTHSWQIRLREEKGGPVIDWEDGARYRFTLREGKLYQCQQYAAMELVKGEGGYRLHRKDAEGKKDYLFSGSGALLRVEEGNGRILDLRWDEEERLSFLEDKQGNSLSFRYHEDGTLETVSDHTGRSSRFAYGDGRLKGITNPMGGTEAYTYGENGKLCTIRNEEGNVIVRNHYDNRRRILRQEYPGGGEQCYLYLDRENKVRFTECDGTVTDYIHDSRLRHRKTRQEGKEEGYAYTPQGQIHCHTDARGGKEEYRYREEGEWIYRKDRDGTEEQAVYNERGRLCAFLYKDGGETTYDYDGEGRMVCVTSPMGRKTEAAYDGEGRVSALRYPGLGERSAVYDNRGRIMKLVLPDGVEYQYRYDALNRLVETWDEEGKSTRLTYDILNRLTGITLPDGEERSYDYNACGSLTGETTKDGSTRWTYGAMEELLKKTDSIGREVCFDMDSLRRITRVRLPEGEELVYGYEKGQLRPTRMPDGSSIRYDAGGNAVEVKSPGGRTMGLTYDACGRLLSILKEGVTVMELTYNASGRVSSLKTFGKKTEYFYNKEGWRIRKKEEGKETAYGYDEAGRLLWEKERDEAGTLLKERRYQEKEKKEEDLSCISRYPDGKIRSLEDAMGTVLRYEYDAMGHLNRILRGESVHQSVKHNARGQVTEVCDGEGNRRTYHYDADGLLDVHTDEDGNTSRYAYDLLGRLTKASQEGAPPIYYTYNGSGRLACVEQDGEKILLPEQATRGEEALPQEERDEQGRLIVLRFPGGICRYIDYTEEGMTECLTVMDGKGLLHRRHYDYDQRGNCTSVTREGRLRPEENGTTSYAYDVLDRLTETRIAGETMARYAYDAYGNRTYFWDRGKETFYTYDRLDRLIEERSGEGSRAYGYDRRGSLLWIKEDGKTVVSCVYDGRGNLVRKEEKGCITGYRYDALNRRREKSVTQDGESRVTYYRHDPTQRIHSLREVQREEKRMRLIYGTDGFLTRTEEEEETLHYITDPNGTPLFSFTEKGEVKESFSYDEFGRSSERSSLPIGYGGYEEEGDGTLLAGCRYYVPRLGRFLSRDRLGGTARESQSQNPYLYVRNNPLTYTDPDGLSPVRTVLPPYVTGEAVPSASIPYAAAAQGNLGQMPVSAGGCTGDNYMDRVSRQLAYGKFTDEVTLLGTTIELLLGISDLDLPMDIRDITADFVKWENSWSHAGWTLVDIIGLVPIVGAVKYVDELVVLGKRGLKYLGEAWNGIRKEVKQIGELDAFKKIKNFFTGGGDKGIKEAGDAVESALKGGLKTLDTGDLKVIETKSPEIANNEWLTRGYDKPPYNTNFEVKVVQAGNEEYVRVFSYSADGNSNKLGGWLMKKSDVEGLTPAQIADKYALPNEPTHICDVKVSPDANLQTGIANPVSGWGSGGGQQFDTMGKKLPQSAFVNERPIGD